MLKTVSVALLLLVASELRSWSDESTTTVVPPEVKSQAIAEQKGGLQNMPFDEVIALIDSAAASGNHSVVIEGLGHGHPGVMSAALKVVTEQHIKSAMPKLMSMYEWFNSDEAPIFTGNTLIWDEGRDYRTIQLSSEVVAAIDAITGSVIQKPRDTSQAESRRYLKEVKTRWNANSNLILTEDPKSLKEFRARVEEVKRLGEERSVESIPMLISGLMKITPLVTNNVSNFEETYPASAALVQIGEPAVSQIVTRFELTSSDPERLVLLHTLMRIKGVAWVARYLSQLGERSESPALKARLGELQQWVQSH
ncbi:hypothetical protein ACXR0O_02350 [Verrucomicrobiota bacterium sgz303538]